MPACASTPEAGADGRAASTGWRRPSGCGPPSSRPSRRTSRSQRDELPRPRGAARDGHAGAGVRGVHRRDRRLVAAQPAVPVHPARAAAGSPSSPARAAASPRPRPTARSSRSAASLAWQPGARLAFTWRQASFAPGPGHRGRGPLRGGRRRDPGHRRASRLGDACRRSTSPVTPSPTRSSCSATANGGRRCSRRCARGWGEPAVTRLRWRPRPRR